MKDAQYTEYDGYLVYNNLPGKDLLASFTYKSFYTGLAHLDREIMRLWFVEEICNLELTCVSPKQVHGNTVAIAGDTSIVEDTDGLITDKKDLILSIVVADCLPVYLWEKNAKVLSLVHAGWRGTSINIIDNAIKLFNKKYKIAASDLFALLGPCICQKCFEVGPEVSALFDKDVIIKGRGDRSQLDLRQANVNQLIGAGMDQDNIYSDKRCTFCNAELFYSFRRDGKDAGRMFAALGIYPENKRK